MRGPLATPRFCLAVLPALLALAGCAFREDKGTGAAAAEEKEAAALAPHVSFAEVYAKVLDKRCAACHGNSGGIDLSDYASARQHLDKIRQSALSARTMPKAPFPPLTREERILLAAWVGAGGPEFALDGSSSPPLPPPEILKPNFASIQKLVLDRKCVECHRPDSPSDAHRIPLRTLDEILASPLEIVIPGNPDESDLMLVFLPDARKPMPPRKSGITPLKPEEIGVIADWIRAGARD